MENVNFQPSGEEIERALMDLGPLLGVSIKEETPDEQPDLSALPPNANNVGSGEAGASAGPSNGGSTGGEGSGKESADSLASPGTPRPPPSAARCAACNQSLTQLEGTPKLMECLHSICESCLKAKVEEKQASSRDFLGAERITITCPQCRLQCQPANMIDQRFVLEKMAEEQAGSAGGLSGEQQCNSCEDTEPATSYCVECGEFICDNCVLAHQRLKITKDHTIKCKDEAVAELLAASSARSSHDMYCREHVQERLSLFCETCDRLTCRDCQLQHHRDHKYQFSEEMAAQARTSISGLLSEVSYKRVLLGSAMKVIRDRQDLIADKKKALVHDITQTVVKLTNAINTRGKQLVLRLNEVCDGKLRTLTEKKEALEQLAAITDHCLAFTGGVLAHASDTALLHAKRQVTAHLQRIKARRADIPNPEIPVRITLALDKLPDLVRVLSSIGAIVVDGKVDGGGATSPAAPPAPAQGPYHPPQLTQQHSQQLTQQHNQQLNPQHNQQLNPQHNQQLNPQHNAQHNAVVALHHAAHMHQSFVGGYPVGGGLRARAHTPLRHPHVTSTTHPHHLHGMSEMNLRGLLNAAGARGVRPQHNASVQHAMHAYHQMMGAYAGGSFPASGVAVSNTSGAARRSMPRTPSPAPHNYPQHGPAKWHIPQHNNNGTPELSAGGSGAEYKITLGRARVQPSPVTSTNPKTPSPSLNGGVAHQELDKVCAESVQDLMATIAKLDSNGVQVVAEPAGQSPAPLVHSSTDALVDSRGKAAAGGSGDPNEDWCAVCMDGGELMCCDKCPKVFHQYCHIPTIDKLPDETETWQCLLCVKFSPLVGEADTGALSPRAQRLIERITLELYCQYETSLAFRELVPQDNVHYHAKISQPMCLDTIRMKLQPSAPQRYTTVAHFVADCRLLFRNALHYNPPDSQIYKDAKQLEEFFDAQLAKWLPEYVAWSGAGEPPVKRPRPDCPATLY